jgi:hypothetical protein
LAEVLFHEAEVLMSEISGMTRREFSLEAALAILSGVAITISGCGGSSNPAAPSNPTPAPTPTPDASGDKVGAISANHGHVARITGAQLTAGNGFALDIQGTATHTHTVILSNADIQAIAGNQQVARVSSNTGGHDHTVTFN